MMDPTQGAEARVGSVVLARFRIEAFLSSGATSHVYRGVQTQAGRRVAIKVLRTKANEAPRRFRREIRFLKAVRHPHVVELIDYGQAEDGAEVMVMELLDGASIQRTLQTHGPMRAARVGRIGGQIADALDALHQLGGVHRDLKPENVVLETRASTPDFVKVVDFGLVKPFGHIATTMPSLTQMDRVLGTPLYMAPEQISDQPIDARTDIYALGVMLFEMLTGKLPFERDSVIDIMYGHLNDPVPALRAVHPGSDCPPPVETLVRQCLEKEPGARPPSMAALAEALRIVGA